jgi:hypothetical protein
MDNYKEAQKQPVEGQESGIECAMSVDSQILTRLFPLNGIGNILVVNKKDLLPWKNENEP